MLCINATITIKGQVRLTVVLTHEGAVVRAITVEHDWRRGQTTEVELPKL